MFTLSYERSHASNGEALLVQLFLAGVVTLDSLAVLGIILHLGLPILQQSELLGFRHVVFEAAPCRRLGVPYLGQLYCGTVLANLDWRVLYHCLLEVIDRFHCLEEPVLWASTTRPLEIGTAEGW